MSARRALQSTWPGGEEGRHRLEDLSFNHADGIVSMDLFGVPTLSFRCYMAF
jgi:hypothetical protein